jgi:hypothetical protein
MAFLARLAGTLTRPVALRDGGDRGRGPGAAGGSGVERLSAAWLGERLGGWEDAGPEAGIGEWGARGERGGSVNLYSWRSHWERRTRGDGLSHNGKASKVSSDQLKSIRSLLPSHYDLMTSLIL